VILAVPLPDESRTTETLSVIWYELGAAPEDGTGEPELEVAAGAAAVARLCKSAAACRS
jgi:hypothetical protein